MSGTVFANGLDVSARQSDDQCIAAMPDVCLSPPSPPAGPIPIPYPNFSQASDTTDGTKTVKIAGDEIDGSNAVLSSLVTVLRIITAKKEAAMDFGMQGLDASAEHFGPTGKFGDVFNGDVVFAKQLGGAAGREDFDFKRREATGKIDDTVFVENAEQRPLYGHGSSGENRTS